jgi:hypothetical protein
MRSCCWALRTTWARALRVAASWAIVVVCGRRTAARPAPSLRLAAWTRWCARRRGRDSWRRLASRWRARTAWRQGSPRPQPLRTQQQQRRRWGRQRRQRRPGVRQPQLLPPLLPRALRRLQRAGMRTRRATRRAACTCASCGTTSAPSARRRCCCGCWRCTWRRRSSRCSTPGGWRCGRGTPPPPQTTTSPCTRTSTARRRRWRWCA